MHAIEQALKSFHRRLEEIINVRNGLCVDRDRVDIIDTLGRLQGDVGTQQQLRASKVCVLLADFQGLRRLSALVDHFAGDRALLTAVVQLLEEIFCRCWPSRSDVERMWMKWDVESIVGSLQGVVDSGPLKRRCTAIANGLDVSKKMEEELRERPFQMSNETSKLLSLMRIVREQKASTDDTLVTNISRMCCLFSTTLKHVHPIVRGDVYQLLLDLAVSTSPISCPDASSWNLKSANPVVLDSLLQNFARLHGVSEEFVDALLAEIDGYIDDCSRVRQEPDCLHQQAIVRRIDFGDWTLSWPELPPLHHMDGGHFNIQLFIELIHRFLKCPNRFLHKDASILDTILNYLTRIRHPFVSASLNVLKALIYNDGDDVYVLDASYESCLRVDDLLRLELPALIGVRLVDPVSIDECCMINDSRRALGQTILDDIWMKAEETEQAIRTLMADSRWSVKTTQEELDRRQLHLHMLISLPCFKDRRRDAFVSASSQSLRPS